ncbi:MAG TPA: glycosyltransferase [Chloroflexia bacterium]|nr:glycosyltransferase [Chloroflexia bacterium]
MTLSHLPDLSIIIVNWNVAGLLEACLRSLPAALGHWSGRAEVLVVDNASTDGSVEMVRHEFPGVRLIALDRNLGFSGGNNTGIRASCGKYLFLLNPDTIAHPGSISTLADYIEAHSEVGIVAPRLLNPDGTLQPSRRRFPTLATALIESTPLQRWLPDAPTLGRFYMLDKPDGETQEVDWVSGAALMCRREALMQAGLLDPGYFMFSEEVDLCRRVSNAGWRVVYLPEAVITHYGGQSTGQDVPSRHIRFNTSKARYFRLHEGRMAGTVVRLYLLLTYVLQSATEAVKWLLGHKRPLRSERLKMYAQVLRSRLRERRDGLLDKKRVLLITGEYPPAQGGVGDYTCKLNLALQRQGIIAKVLTRSTSAPNSPHQRQLSFVDGSARQDGSRAAPTDNVQNVPYNTLRITLASTLSALKGMRAGIAHIQYQTGAYEMRPTINLLPLLLRRKWRGATVVTFHDLLVPYLFPKAGRVREWANRLLARGADGVIATNPEDAARLRSWSGEHVHLIPIGSNIPNSPPADYNREAWRAMCGVSSDTTLLAYFGFLNSSKGLGDLLVALSTLKDKGKYRLLMVGGGLGSSDPTNQGTAEALDRQARELGLHDSLIWTGYLDPQGVSAALLSADIAVLPYADGASFRRGSLLAVLEHSLPLITTTPGPSPKSKVQSLKWPELVDGENALLVAPGDAVALAKRIEMLAADPYLRTSLAARAEELARFFSWDSIAQMHVDLYINLMMRKRL